ANGDVLYEQATTWIYAPGGTTPLAQRQNGKLCYIVTDHLGSPRELLSEQGEVVWSNSPQVWGLARLWKAANDEGETWDCPFRFPGQYHDPESGLHYNRHRYYDPHTAQYLTPDPLGLGGGNRPQGYVHNPMGWVDPLGLAGDCCAGGTKSSGKEFEAYLHETLGGTGSFYYKGREFDGAYGKDNKIWYEAKSGRYWQDYAAENTAGLTKFKSDIGAHKRIANDAGATYEVHSNTPIPQHIKDWLTKKGIPFREH
ncbi:RHS domain-containing protein, partial [Pseudomonas sp. ZM23]